MLLLPLVLIGLLGFALALGASASLRQMLAKRQGTERCRSCGYSLEGVRTSVCPECGASQLGATAPSERGLGRWWLMCVLGPGLGALFSLRSDPGTFLGAWAMMSAPVTVVLVSLVAIASLPAPHLSRRDARSLVLAGLLPTIVAETVFGVIAMGLLNGARQTGDVLGGAMILWLGGPVVGGAISVWTLAIVAVRLRSRVVGR